ncbi:hypothetical protein TCDM_10123 [Trypanosoma cruzi Dm28c]|uniref:Uncharacterized protein n=1 Tax=Trypanosoma cruzi Dm28c TaxID=1416333 RepID=V5ANF1_TRYCR|nr:hypothetical protein TCDM_10123 [Trypanosoma cruzi Dm28c]
MCSSRVCGWEWCPDFLATSQDAVGEGGVDHRSVQAAGCGYKTAQKRTQYTAGVRGHARQTVVDGQFKRIRREGPIHIPVTRRRASTNSAENGGDCSTCNANSVTEEQIFLLTTAEHRRGPKSTAAQPIPESGDVVPPRLGASKALGSRGHQAVSHGPLAAWRNHRGGHDCSPPVCSATSARGRLPLQHTRPTTFRPSRYMWDAAPCRSYGASVHLQPCGYSGQRRCTRRGASIPVSCTQGKGSMFPSWQHACLSRNAVLRPRSVGWQMAVRVHTRGGRPLGNTQYALRSHIGKRDAAAADPRCLCRVVGQLRVHAAWGGGEVLSCRRGWYI